MPLIKVEKEIPRVKKNVSFEKDVLKDIEIYSKMLGKKFDIESISLIVNEGMKYFLSKDKDFKDYKKLNVKTDDKTNSNEGNDKENNKSDNENENGNSGKENSDNDFISLGSDDKK